MGISNISVILLFIIPGILAERISQNIDYPSKKEQSNFRETIRGILLSLPIISIGSIIFSLIFTITTLKDFINILNNLFHLFVFIILILFIAIIVGIIDGATKDFWRKPLNFMRGKLGKMPADGKTCWQKFLIDENRARYLEVIYNGHSYKGFAKHYSSTGDEAEIVLNIDEILYEYTDFDLDELFTKVIEIYINTEKNVVIKDYDMNEYNKWCESKETESQS